MDEKIEGAAPEAAPATEPEATPDPAALKAEIEQIRAEKAQAAAELEKERTLRLAHERAVSKAQQEKTRLEDVVAKINDLDKKLELNQKLQSGEIDANQYRQTIAEMQTQRQTAASQSVINTVQQRAVMEIKASLDEAGININDPAVLEKVKPLVEEGDFVGAVKAAERLARDKVTPKVDEAEITKRIKAQILEETKGNPAFKSVNAKPEAKGSTPKEILARAAAGDGSVTRQMYEEAKSKL